MQTQRSLALRSFAIALLATAALALTGCAPAAGPVIEPVTVAAADLQGTTQDLEVGQVLNITTGSLDVDSYSAEVSDDSIVKFEKGREDGGTTYDPGFTGLKSGSTEVTLTNDDGGIQALKFTINVK